MPTPSLVANQNFLVPGPTFVVELVIFLVVLWALAKWVLPYVNRAMEERQEAIQRSITEAEEAKKRAEELEKRYQQALEEGRAEAQRLREEAVKTGEQLRQQLVHKGEDEYNRLLARATADIEATARRVAEDLRAQASSVVMAVVERVLGQGLTLEDQSAVIERAIAELEAQERPGAGPLPGGEPVGAR
jgi:F-type H+-transporting ATPase subunit b